MLVLRYVANTLSSLLGSKEVIEGQMNNSVKLLVSLKLVLLTCKLNNLFGSWLEVQPGIELLKFEKESGPCFM